MLTKLYNLIAFGTFFIIVENLPVNVKNRRERKGTKKSGKTSLWIREKAGRPEKVVVPLLKYSIKRFPSFSISIRSVSSDLLFKEHMGFTIAKKCAHFFTSYFEFAFAQIYIKNIRHFSNHFENQCNSS